MATRYHQFTTETDSDFKILHIDLEDGLKPLELQTVLHNITTLYNIGVFNRALLYYDDGFLLSNRTGHSTRYHFMLEESFLAPDFTFPEVYTYDMLQHIRATDVNQMVAKFDELYQLRLVRINYNSPGGLDLAGLGKIAESIKDYLIENKRIKLEEEKFKEQMKSNELERKERKQKITEGAEHHKLKVQLRNEMLKLKRLQNLELIIKIQGMMKDQNMKLEDDVLSLANELTKLQDEGTIGEINVFQE